MGAVYSSGVSDWLAERTRVSPLAPMCTTFVSICLRQSACGWMQRLASRTINGKAKKVREDGVRYLAAGARGNAY